MKTKLLVIAGLIILILSPAYLSQEEGNLSGTFNGTLSGFVNGTLDPLSLTPSSREVREYKAWTRDTPTTGILIDFHPFDIDPYDTTHSCDSQAQFCGHTTFDMTLGCQLQVPGIGQSSSCSLSVSVDNTTVCTTSLSMAFGGSGANSNHYAYNSKKCQVSHLSNTHWVIITTAVLGNTNTLHHSTQVTQTELRTPASYASTPTPFTSTINDGTISGTLSGSVSNSSCDNCTINGGLEPQDHNVTIIEGDTNMPAMRVYGWVIGFTAFVIILAEWKRDQIYYFLSTVALIYATIEMPDFFPETLRFLPIAIMMYMAFRIWALRTGKVGDARPREDD